MKRRATMAAILWLAAGCLPARRDLDLTDDAAVDAGVKDTGDAGDTGKADLGDVKADVPDVDAGPVDSGDTGADIEAPDVPADVPVLGCKLDSECAAFGGACTTATCNTKSGKCAVVAVADNTPCGGQNSGGENKCALSVTCQKGVCLTVPAVCDDGNGCTVDSCDPKTGCSYSEIGLVCGPDKKSACGCDDGDACTEKDACSAKSCLGKPKTCDDGKPCTENKCDKALGCSFPATKAGGPCDDGDPICTSDDKCVGGVCTGTAKVCPADASGDPCKIALCNQLNAQTDCKPPGCTAATNGCAANPNPGAACDDGDVCTTGDTCSSDFDSVCTGKVDLCEDDNPCTTDSCAAPGGCKHAALDQVACKTGGACAASGTCNAGTCSAPAAPCSDGNVCTDDSCDTAKGCVHADNNTACSDGDACTEFETCVGGVCTGGSPVSTDDANDCTSDSCDVAKGPSWSAKTYGTACPGGNSCVGGTCVSSKSCGDGVCGTTEDTGSCPADCPSGGGSCAASNASCLSTCVNKTCGDAHTLCISDLADNGCVALDACAGQCAAGDAWCTLGCILPTGPLSLQLWLSVQWCKGAFCVANGWQGKPCVAASPTFATCRDGCEGALCLQAAATCKATTGCAALRTCLDACAGDATCEGACSGDAAAIAAAKALRACSKAACQ